MRAERSIHPPGFTLVEVLIATSIVALISTLLFGAFSRFFDSRDLVARVQERYHNVQVALERMAREISMAYVYDCRDLPKSTGEKRFKTLFKSQNEGKFDRLTFSSFSHLRLVRDAHESDQNVLTYRSERDPQDGAKTNLVRIEKVHFDPDPETGGKSDILARDVQALKLEFFDETKNDWVDEWDCSQVERLNRLPRLVRIQMNIVSEHGEEIPFTTTTRLFIQKPLSNWLKPAQ